MSIIVQGKIVSFIILAIIWIAIIVSVELNKRRSDIRTRIFPALEAIDEVVARAAEMGKPIHFCPMSARVMHAEGGQTVAAMAVLHYITRQSIKDGVRIISSVGNPQALPLMEEAIESAYIIEGDPEGFRREDIFFFGSGYRSAVMDLLLNERPAANFLIGAAYGEALLFAETGNRIEAMQICGSARITNLSFLAAICDYCFFGEELYAAGASLSKDDVLLGSIRGQDIGKLIALFLLILGFITFNIGFPFMKELLKI